PHTRDLTCRQRPAPRGRAFPEPAGIVKRCDRPLICRPTPANRQQLPLFWKAMDHRIGHLIGRENLPGHGQALPVHEPATGQVIGELRDADAIQVDAAVAAAARAFPAWAALPPARRGRHLHALANAIEARLEDFARAESRDTGKPLRLTRELDIPRAITNLRFFAGAGEHFAS